jgi:hypothetical protein
MFRTCQRTQAIRCRGPVPTRVDRKHLVPRLIPSGARIEGAYTTLLSFRDTAVPCVRLELRRTSERAKARSLSTLHAVHGSHATHIQCTHSTGIQLSTLSRVPRVPVCRRVERRAVCATAATARHARPAPPRVSSVCSPWACARVRRTVRCSERLHSSPRLEIREKDPTIHTSLNLSIPPPMATHQHGPHVPPPPRPSVAPCCGCWPPTLHSGMHRGASKRA